MVHWAAGTEASVGESVHRYERHRPEQTLLYQVDLALSEVGVGGSLAAAFEGWSGEDARDTASFCRRIEALIALGK